VHRNPQSAARFNDRDDGGHPRTRLLTSDVDPVVAVMESFPSNLRKPAMPAEEGGQLSEAVHAGTSSLSINQATETWVDGLNV
jgi:hypothetical protein